jgi:hypothetical protein
LPEPTAPRAPQTHSERLDIALDRAGNTPEACIVAHIAACVKGEVREGEMLDWLADQLESC